MITAALKNLDLERLRKELIREGFTISKKHFHYITDEFNFDISFSYKNTNMTVWQFNGSRQYPINIPTFKKFITIKQNILSIDSDGIKSAIDKNVEKRKAARNNKNVALFNLTMIKALVEGQLSESKIKFEEIETGQTNRLSYDIEIDGEMTFESSISFNFKSNEHVGIADLSKLMVTIDECNGKMLFDDFLKIVNDYNNKALPEYIINKNKIDENNKIYDIKYKEYAKLMNDADVLRGIMDSVRLENDKLLNSPYHSLVSKLSKKVKL